MPRPLPYPIVIQMVVFGAASVLLGLSLLTRGTLPRWLPSGYVDHAGKRAELSQSVHRLRRKRSTQVWSMLALFSVMAIDWMVFYSPRP